MAREPEDDRLLHEVLAETVSPQFRQELLQDTLRHARQRRRRRRVLPAAGVALSLAVLVIALTWLPALRTQRGGAEAVGLIVSTQSLEPGRIVCTQPFRAMTRTGEGTPVVVVRTSYGSGPYRIVGDKELLALAAPRPTVLIRVGPHAQELVFADDLAR